jgi:nicotinate-nucleotide adenylyltransferase
MVKAACEGDPRFVASRLEEGDKKSYSIDTIERVRAEGGDIYFVIGADAFAEIGSWHRAVDVIRSVEFIVVTRPGHVYEIPPGAKVHRLETLALPHSSSEIRRALARGGTPSDLPPKVADYIRKNALYRA